MADGSCPPGMPTLRRYAVTIRERDEVAWARGEFMGTFFWCDTIDAPTPEAAREIARVKFLAPLDVDTLPEDQRWAGEALEALAQPKRAAFLRGECEITARKSQARR